MAVPAGLMCGGGMMGGMGGWLMMGSSLLFFGLVILSIAALVKYLFWSDRRSPPA